jgi:hypothetical protein
MHHLKEKALEKKYPGIGFCNAAGGAKLMSRDTALLFGRWLTFIVIPGRLPKQPITSAGRRHWSGVRWPTPKYLAAN